MGELRELAGDDPDIATGIMSTFLTFSKSMIEDVIPQLKNKLPNRHTQLEISYTPDGQKSKIIAAAKSRKNKQTESMK